MLEMIDLSVTILGPTLEPLCCKLIFFSALRTSDGKYKECHATRVKSYSL